MLHQALPELDLDKIDMQQSFLGKTLQYPLLINAMTGGTDLAAGINRSLAAAARDFGLAMAVGSQHIALAEPVRRPSFTVVREVNPHGPIIANVSALARPADALAAIEMVEADGLQLHLNVPQELAMREGERHFAGVLDNIGQIAALSPVPIIVKEVGFGLCKESVRLLHQAGITWFDTGGQGGTNFIAIEDLRQGCFAGELNSWGLPTAASLAEIISLRLPVQVIASGGVRSAADAAKAICMGARLVGMAGPLLKILIHQGPASLNAGIEEWIYRLRAVFLMTGSQSIEALQSKPLLILGKTAAWLAARHIDPHYWSRSL